MAETKATFYEYARVIYRLPEPGQLFERWTGEEWEVAAHPIGLSEEEFLGLREISAEEATKLTR